ncbi:glycosyltransferase family 4 protein [Fulvivirga sp. 29W222]|uniref:Glycosyltransferase family 4 protein n=1 Tax=Fulvivirga marina TaxID=2494733 RepID=A0A937KAR6_9BACT|nr:glycosyltransferase family 4 protein [Fulvivirga marina]MBL6444829.1 glycosyltransferase family 4 protein [Fulvivirga marina]
MKVAIVLNTSWNVYNFRMGLIKALRENNHEVIVIAPEDEYSKRIIDTGCDFHKVKMDSRGANPIKDFALIFELYGIYKKTRPDVILHYTIKPNIYGTLAASLLKIPTINNVCGLGTVFLQKGMVSKIALFMYKVAFRFPKKVFFQNNHDYELFIRERLVRKRISDILPGSGIDVSHFPALPFKRNKRFTFLLISRLIHDKGVIEYIDAIKQLKSQGVDAQFQILGAKDPKHKRGIKLEIIDEWINSNIIEYLGTTDDVRQFINKADCVVLPSYREGTPRTLLEAASSAKPIVATDVPGCNNVVQDNFNGFLCRLKSSEDLAEKMLAMMSLDDQKIELFGKNSRTKVEKEFSEDIVISRYLDSLKELNI